jgi:hypothetical protein
VEPINKNSKAKILIDKRRQRRKWLSQPMIRKD